MRNYVLSFVTLALAGCATPNAPVSVPTLSKDSRATQIGEKSTPASPPTGQQWLYGSAEGSIASAQVYKSMAQYVRAKALNRAIKTQIVLADGSTPDTPRFESCGTKPLAAVFDADETLIWNVGAMRYMAEQGKDFDPVIWNAWEKSGAGKALAMPGAIDALKIMRDAGVTIIANTNRTTANAKGTEDALRMAGLGEFKHQETLYLMGDDASGSSKDDRRAAIASKFCVIALGGDQLGDFAQAFNMKGLSVADRRKLATHPAIADLWGNGWFLFSNPVYGPSIRGGYDEIFTPETKWEPGQ
jgi:5'-nucleotidase (lipoprotein e(P4) family)